MIMIDQNKRQRQRNGNATGSYREIAIAIESEAGDSLTSIDQSGFSRKERNLHCDVHVAPENEHILPPFGSPDSLWMTRSQRSRRRDKGLLRLFWSQRRRQLFIGIRNQEYFIEPNGQ